jgi:hypothetical protein
MVCIIAWSGACSLIIFGGLRLLNLLRIDKETEFSGNDLEKHGEAAYPADAWVEAQYNRRLSLQGDATPPPNMSGTHNNRTVKLANYNNAFEMLPEELANRLAMANGNETNGTK